MAETGVDGEYFTYLMSPLRLAFLPFELALIFSESSPIFPQANKLLILGIFGILFLLISY